MYILWLNLGLSPKYTFLLCLLHPRQWFVAWWGIWERSGEKNASCLPPGNAPQFPSPPHWLEFFSASWERSMEGWKKTINHCYCIAPHPPIWTWLHFWSLFPWWVLYLLFSTGWPSSLKTNTFFTYPMHHFVRAFWRPLALHGLILEPLWSMHCSLLYCGLDSSGYWIC